MARGWTIAPEWLKDLYQLRPCLLYICIAQFHKAVGNYQRSSSSYLNHYYSVFSRSLSCLPASGRSSRLMGNHLVWLTRILSDQYLAPSPTRWEKTNQVFVYLKPVFTLAFEIQYRSSSFLIWINEKLADLGLHHALLYFSHEVSGKWLHDTIMKCVLCQSVASWTISYNWGAHLLIKIIAFGSMPWSGQLRNFTNSSWWKVDLKKCNYTHTPQLHKSPWGPQNVYWWRRYNYQKTIRLFLSQLSREFFKCYFWLLNKQLIMKLFYSSTCWQNK